MRRYKITVTGKVQGVFFRDTARQVATRLGLSGFARNEPDGSVHIEVEGDEVALSKFLKWCTEGSQYAKVQSVTHGEHEPIGHHGFEIG
jgi:acylphosphatase